MASAIPPPPPGFQMVGGEGDIPPPPPGFVPPPPTGMKPVGQNPTYTEDVKRRFHESAQATRHDIRQLGADFDYSSKGKVDPIGLTGRALKTGADVAGTVFSPGTAALDQVNRKVAPGGIGPVSPERMTDIEQMGMAGYGVLRHGGEVVRAANSLRQGKAAITGAAKAFQSGTQPTKDAIRGVKTLLAPATVSDASRYTAATIRSARGRGQLKADQDAERIVRAQRQAGKQSPEWHGSLIRYIENRSSSDRPPDSGPYNIPATGKPGDRVRANTYKEAHENTPIREAANTLRDTYKYYRDRAEYIIRKNQGASPKFLEDYFVHLWKDKPEDVKRAMGAFYRQGSARNIRHRKIPTIDEGIQAGLTPKYDNAFEATSYYIANMSRFLTTHDIQASLKEAPEGMRAYWAFPGKEKPGDVALNGIMTERIPRGQKGRPRGSTGAQPTEAEKSRLSGPNTLHLPGQEEGGGAVEPHVPTLDEQARITGEKGGLPAKPNAQVGAGKQPEQIGEGDLKNVTPKPPKPPRNSETADRGPRKQVLYAPADVARIYNNYISKGLEGTAIGPLFKTLRAGNNALIMAKLGLSAFHGVVMGKEGMLSELARGFQSLSRGQLKQAGKSFVTFPVAPARQYRNGLHFRKAVLNAGNPNDLPDPVMRAFAKSGQQIRMDDFYRTRGAGSFFQSIKRGSFGTDLAKSLNRVVGKDKTALERAKGTVDLVGNVIQSTAAPMFEHFIPTIKQGVFAQSMRDWIEANPGHSEEELIKQATKIGDSVDNRFGELMQDNLFWHRWMKQLAQMTLLSFSWDLGTVREIVGGIKDIPESAKGIMQGKGITPRTAYVAALATFVPMQNAIYQYMKTGKPPKGMDLLAPQTGGRTPYGDPERAAIPGYEKDVYGFSPLNLNGPMSEVGNKLSPAAQIALDYANGKDYRQLPLTKPSDVAGYTPFDTVGEVAEDVAQRLVPISFSNRGKKGTNISGAERAFGIRPSPYWMEDRTRALVAKKKRDTRAWRAREKSDRRIKDEELP